MTEHVKDYYENYWTGLYLGKSALTVKFILAESVGDFYMKLGLGTYYWFVGWAHVTIPLALGATFHLNDTIGIGIEAGSDINIPSPVVKATAHILVRF